MKEIKLYKCDICGTQYESKEECEQCEANHIKPKEIESADYLGIKRDPKGYPSAISVKMSDGEIVWYER